MAVQEEHGSAVGAGLAFIDNKMVRGYHAEQAAPCQRSVVLAKAQRRRQISQRRQSWIRDRHRDCHVRGRVSILNAADRYKRSRDGKEGDEQES